MSRSDPGDWQRRSVARGSTSTSSSCVVRPRSRPPEPLEATSASTSSAAFTTTATTASSSSRPSSRARLRAPEPFDPGPLTSLTPSKSRRRKAQLLKGGVRVVGDSDDSADDNAVRDEIERLRRRWRLQATELQETCGQLEQTQRALRSLQQSREELQLKYGALERTERVTNADLHEEQHKNQELGKQVKAMRQNLANITGDDDGQQATALQKRCFKLMQQNTVLRVHSRLLKRQKAWAEAKGRVLQHEVTSVYLGTHDRVKDNGELEAATGREFGARGAEAQMYKLQAEAHYRHDEAVADFITHVTHTQGKDVHGFLDSSRVFTEAIRWECLSGLCREFWQLWRTTKQLPRVLREAERVVCLKDHLQVFEGFGHAMTSLLGCARARLWMADRSCLWSYAPDANGQLVTCTLALPKSKDPADLAGQGFAAAAYATQRTVSVGEEASSDPRFHEAADAGVEGAARNALCVPVTQRGKQQARVVLQVLDKPGDQQFNLEADARLLRLLGRVSMDVMQVCEANNIKLANNRRKDTLIRLFNDFVPISTPVRLLEFHEQGLKRLFRSGTTALYLITSPTYGHGTRTSVQLMCKQDLQSSMMLISRVRQRCLTGLVGHVARKLNHLSFAASQLSQSPYAALVDLPVPRGCSVHTWPICEGQGCVAVCQFVCPERDHSTISDDGTFHQDNHLHFRLLTILLAFVRKHLDIFEEEE